MPCNLRPLRVRGAQRRRDRAIAALTGAIAFAAATEALADSGWNVGAEYVADVAGPVSGGRSHAGRALDNLSIEVDGDLNRVMSWTGATVHVSFLSNSGGQPNQLAETLQGVDNIEVGRPRAKIYEAWLEQEAGRASVRVGLYDLNSEFYANEAAGLLISPSFGIGSELAATGPNGPSIFPSTAPAARLRLEPSEALYVQAAAIGAVAGVINDPGGVHLNLHDGALAIAEAGWRGSGKLAVGAWSYTKRQAKPFPTGSLSKRRAFGAYMILDRPLTGEAGGVREISAFLRAGVSDGQTTPFRGGGQMGLRIDRPWAGRPNSAISFGLSQGLLSSSYRRELRQSGGRPARSERFMELTYADGLAGRITVQPSVQYIINPRGDRRSKDVVMMTLRLRFNLV